MKKSSLLLLFLFVVTLFAGAQEGIHWRIKHNKQTLLQSQEEDTVKNIIPLSLTDLNTPGHFTITCSATNIAGHKDAWIRTIAVYTATGKELYRKDADAIIIADMQLKKMLLENKTINVFSWAIPKDPVQAARVRVRRVHLCTIELI